MRQGLIVYLVGDKPLPESLDLKDASPALGCPADRVELVSRKEGFFAVEDAWHFLATQGGCSRINLVVAEPEEPGRLRPIGPVVRLCG